LTCCAILVPGIILSQPNALPTWIDTCGDTRRTEQGITLTGNVGFSCASL
jgi:hypothetical protein